MRVATALYATNDVLVAPQYIYEPMTNPHDKENFDTGAMTFEAGYWHRFRRKMKTEADIDAVYKMVRDAMDLAHCNLSIAYFKVGQTSLDLRNGRMGTYWFIDMFYVVEDARRVPYWQMDNAHLPEDFVYHGDPVALYGPHNTPLR